MAHEFTRMAGQGVALTFTGSLNDEEFQAIDQELHKIATSDRSLRYILVDATGLETNAVSSGLIRESALVARDVGQTEDLDTEIVLVMPGDLDYGMARVWSGFFTSPDRQCHIFRSRAEADHFIADLG